MSGTTKPIFAKLPTAVPEHTGAVRDDRTASNEAKCYASGREWALQYARAGQVRRLRAAVGTLTPPAFAQVCAADPDGIGRVLYLVIHGPSEDPIDDYDIDSYWDLWEAGEPDPTRDLNAAAAFIEGALAAEVRN